MAPAGCFFARLPAAFTPAGLSMAAAGCFLRGFLPLAGFFSGVTSEDPL